MKFHEFKIEDNSDKGMNKYGLAAKNKEGKFYSYRHGKLTGTFDNMSDLQKHQHDLIKDESIKEDAPFGSGMDLVRMAVMRKFISAEEYMAYAKELKAAGEEVEQNYDDWPEGEGFGSSDGNFAIKDLMSTAGYEFDEQDTGGRFIVTKMPEKLEKMGIKNVRMKDAVATEDPGYYKNPDKEFNINGMTTKQDVVQSIIDNIDNNELDTAKDSLNQLLDVVTALHEDEDEDVEKAKQIAKDKAGDMTGASQDIDTVKKGLSAHPDVADALKKANEEMNRITKLAGLGEGASMMPYYKDPKDEKQMTWTFPDAWQKDEPLDTPYMSNASMRQFLDALGYNADFEDQSPVPAKEFIARTTQWLQKNINKPSAYEPTQVDQNPGGPKMYSGGREEGHMNRVVKGHNELARKIVAKYPEVTHFGFN